MQSSATGATNRRAGIIVLLNNLQAQEERVRRLQIPRGPGKSRHGRPSTNAQKRDPEPLETKREDTRNSLRHPEHQPTRLEPRTTHKTPGLERYNKSKRHKRGTRWSRDGKTRWSWVAACKPAASIAGEQGTFLPFASPRPRVSSSPRKLTAAAGSWK